MKSSFPRRKKPINFSGLKTVSVERGKSGYGFTISGERPCFLHCVLRGSAAEAAGLRAGDCIMTINGENVSNLMKEDVINKIGMVNGRLVLNIADKDDSHSEDEEYMLAFSRQKPRRGPKRPLTRAEKVVADICNTNKLEAIFEASGKGFGSWPGSSPLPGCFLQKNSAHMDSPLPHNYRMSSSGGSNSNEMCISGNSSSANWEPRKPASISIDPEMKFVVSYLGSVKIPTEFMETRVVLQAIQGCVGCLRESTHKSKHPFVLVRAQPEIGVTLSNSPGSVNVVYPPKKLLCCRLCETDSNVFGLVTSQRDDPMNCVCHVFTVDPHLAPHNNHGAVAERLGFACTFSNGRCCEFLESASKIVPALSVLCQDRLPTSIDNGPLFHKNAAKSSRDSCHSFKDLAKGNGPVLNHKMSCQKFSGSSSQLLDGSENLHQLLTDVDSLSLKDSADSCYSETGKLTSPESTSRNGNPSFRPMNSDACSRHSNVSSEGELKRVASWASDFTRLLMDPVGVKYFTEFLKSEFSDENIKFWLAVEKLKRVTLQKDIAKFANDIYNTFLSLKAPYPVNTDNQSRHLKSLEFPTSTMYDVQQKQIFGLMKFDSYLRFLRSDVYKLCVEAEASGRLLPSDISGRESGADSGVSSTSTNLNKKKSTSTDSGLNSGVTDDRSNEDSKIRRKSLLPWNRKKKTKISTDIQTLSRKLVKGKYHHKYHPETSNLATTVSYSAESLVITGKTPLVCQILLPDGSLTLAFVQPVDTVHDMLKLLCLKHNLPLPAVDLYKVGDSLPIGLDDPATSIVNLEVYLERRVLFRMTLPNGKIIGVKSKPQKSIVDVIRPVLQKYGFSIDNLIVRLQDSPIPISMTMAVAILDQDRVLIETIEQYSSLRVLASHSPLPDGNRIENVVGAATPNEQHNEAVLAHSNTSKDNWWSVTF